jgi:hypothetical protein
MDLKTKLKNSKRIRPDLKEKLLAIFDLLTDEQKQKLETALDPTHLYKQAVKEIKKVEKKVVKKITQDIKKTERKQISK